MHLVQNVPFLLFQKGLERFIQDDPELFFKKICSTNIIFISQLIQKLQQYKQPVVDLLHEAMSMQLERLRSNLQISMQ